MWTKNGEQSLPRVLSQVDEVIPQECIHNKIMVDDCSTDKTVDVGKDFNWIVYKNPSSGISSGANIGLSYVDCSFFISMEQDILLATNWWDKIPELLENEKVAIASGVRITNNPIAVRKLQEYTTERYRRETQHKTSFLYGKTLDNTIYKTEILRKLGGFPKLKINAGVDTVLAKKINDCGMRWLVDFDVKSIHLRRGLYQELKHYYWYGLCYKELRRELGETIDSFWHVLLRSGFSPMRGLQIAYKQKCWQISYVYPLIRFSILLGIVGGYL